LDATFSIGSPLASEDSLEKTIELLLIVCSEGTRLAWDGHQLARTSAQKKRNVHCWKPRLSTVKTVGLSLKSDSGQLSGVCSEAAPVRMEAAEHRS
jgi:hypothetical protein